MESSIALQKFYISKLCKEPIFYAIQSDYVPELECLTEDRVQT